MRMQLKCLVEFLEAVGGEWTAVIGEGVFGNNVR